MDHAPVEVAALGGVEDVEVLLQRQSLQAV
jgi:hypothetical protein